jgi:hypothetical protein
MSTTMHAFDFGVSLASNSDGLPNVVTRKPEAESSLFKERRTDGSSSTTSTVAGLIVPTSFVSLTFDLALLDGRSSRAAASFLAKLVTILMFQILFQTPVDAVRSIWIAAACFYFVTNV